MERWWEKFVFWSDVESKKFFYWLWMDVYVKDFVLNDYFFWEMKYCCCRV